MIVTIDGPAGAGKSTVAREVARRLGFSYLDSGAIYRTLTLAVLERGADPASEEECLAALDASRLEFVERQGEDGVAFVPYLDGRDVSHDIREPRVSRAVSIVAAHARVRERLLAFQKAWARTRNVVCDGRDMGTRVFPEAEKKFFLVARAEVRAKRRYKELREKGVEASFEDVLANIRSRDERDSARAASPLAIPPDAVVIDTSDLTAEEVVSAILAYITGGSER
jgi:cytidylate kinase